jgi:integrase
VKFPVTVTNRRAKVKIFAPKKKFAYYRIYYRTGGKSHFHTFETYGAAKKAAEKKAGDLAKNLAVVSLTPKEAAAALAIRDALQTHYQTTGRRYSAIEAITAALEADKLLGGISILEAARGYLTTVATVKRVDLKAAVEEFNTFREPMTKVKDNGKRAQLSPGYHALVSAWLLKFAGMFPGHAVCDMTREHLDKFMAEKSKQSPKSRNLYRGAISLFLGWAISKDYLSQTHRLMEAPGMKPETADSGEIGVYSPDEFRAMLENANADILPVLAIGGLAGIRLGEILRLEWEDVWRITGHIEIKSTKAKTRQRRLVEITPALAKWLAPYAKHSGPVYDLSDDMFNDALNELLESEKVKVKKHRNGLRHSFCSYHFALYANENLTAQQAGNSPAMIHKHYKGLATKDESEKWFAVVPAQPANVVAMPAKESIA